MKYSNIEYCKICKNVFKIVDPKKANLTCSNECMKLLYKTDEYRKIISDRLKGKAGGLREGGGKSQVFVFFNKANAKMYLNNNEIKVARWLDTLNINWIRNTKGFEYLDIEGNNKKYYPDFYLPDLNIYIEYKGWLDNKNSVKMKNAILKNNLELLLIFSTDKRYAKLGLNLDQLTSTTILKPNKIETINILNKFIK